MKQRDGLTMTLFDAIARSLGPWKGVHQTKTAEPETPTSAPESQIIVHSDAAAQQAGFSPALRDTFRVIRRDVLATFKAGAGFRLSSAEDGQRGMSLPSARQ
jgi:hypothetical protein